MSDVFWAAFGGGAAAGIFSLTAEWFRWYLDRPLVNVKISTGFISSQVNVDNSKQIFLEATNPHTKPVTLTSFGLAYQNPKWGTLYISPQIGFSFPHILSSGMSIKQWSSVEDLVKTLKKSSRTPSDLKYAWFRSPLKEFHYKIPDLIITELQEEFDKK